MKAIIDLEWLTKQVQIGNDLTESWQIVRDHGFTEEEIHAAIEAVRPRGNALLDTRPPPIVRHPPRKLKVFDNPRVQLYMLPDFMSKKECQQIIEAMDGHLRPSETTYTADADFRTSMSVDLCYLSHPSILSLENKISATMGINSSYGEGTQAQRYEVGGQFKPHMDTFDGSDYDRLVGLRGQRTWTFMVYLNDVEEGGHTLFTELDMAVKPARGMAVFWNNLLPDGSINPMVKHAGLPVIRGEKIIITKWFRVFGHGPVYLV